MLETVLTTDGSSYQAWQADLLAFSHRSTGQQGELTRVVIASGSVPAFAGFTVQVAPHDAYPASYPPYNKPWGIAEWLRVAPTRQRAILLLDPDCVFLSTIDLPVIPGQPIAQPAPYLDPWCHSDLIRRHGLSPEGVQPIGIPLLVHQSDLSAVAPHWVARTNDILEDRRSHKQVGWVAEMWGYALAAASLDLHHAVVPLAHLCADDCLSRPLIHYCDRAASVDGSWGWDKRSYLPWTLPLPAPEATPLAAAAVVEIVSYYAMGQLRDS